MPRTCTVCGHPDRVEIDKALIDRTPFRHIAEQRGLSATALVRHFDDHLARDLVRAKEAENVANADDILGHVVTLRDRALKILDAAEKAADYGTALRAIREARESLRLLGELAGKLQAQGTVNLILSAEWISIQATVLTALEPFPDARVALVESLKGLESHVSRS